MPAKAPNVGRGRPAGSTTKELESPREDILADVEKMIEEGKSQQDIIKYLRGLGFDLSLLKIFYFTFLDLSLIKKMWEKQQTISNIPIHSLGWQDVSNGLRTQKQINFDPMVIFGFSILGGPSKKIIPYLYKERKKPLRAQVGKNVISFSQAEFTKLPKYMREDERIKFSTEQRQLLLNPEKKPSKFFMRWVDDAIFPDSVKEKIEEIKNR